MTKGVIPILLINARKKWIQKKALPAAMLEPKTSVIQSTGAALSTKSFVTLKPDRTIMGMDSRKE